MVIIQNLFNQFLHNLSIMHLLICNFQCKNFFGLYIYSYMYL